MFKLFNWFKISAYFTVGKQPRALAVQTAQTFTTRQQASSLPALTTLSAVDMAQLRENAKKNYLGTFSKDAPAPVSIHIDTDSDSGDGRIPFPQLIRKIGKGGVILKVGYEIKYFPASVFTAFGSQKDKRELLELLVEAQQFGKISVSGHNPELVTFVQNWIKDQQNNTPAVSLGDYLNYHSQQITAGKRFDPSFKR